MKVEDATERKLTSSNRKFTLCYSDQLMENEVVPLAKSDSVIIRKRSAEPKVDGHVKAARLERACRLAFPVAFVGFNVFYWLKYWYFQPEPCNAGEC